MVIRHSNQFLIHHQWKIHNEDHLNLIIGFDAIFSGIQPTIFCVSELIFHHFEPDWQTGPSRIYTLSPDLTMPTIIFGSSGRYLTLISAEYPPGKSMKAIIPVVMSRSEVHETILVAVGKGISSLKVDISGVGDSVITA